MVAGAARAPGDSGGYPRVQGGVRLVGERSLWLVLVIEFQLRWTNSVQ
jgi:hypothetical protein